MSRNAKSTKKDGKPSAQEASTSSGMMWPMPLWNPNQMWMTPPGTPMAMHQGAHQPSQRKVQLKPWENESNEESDSSSEEFRPKKVRRMAAAGASASGEPTKRGRGRPSKAEVARRQSVGCSSSSAGAPTAAGSEALCASVVAKYPEQFEDFSWEYANARKDECSACHLWLGKVLLLPCGHSKFCYKCVNHLHKEANALKRPSKCLNPECFQLVSNWLVMFNVNE